MRRTASRALLVSLALALAGAASRADERRPAAAVAQAITTRPTAERRVHERFIVKTVGDRVWAAHFGDLGRTADPRVPTIVAPGIGDWVALDAAVDAAAPADLPGALAELGVAAYGAPRAMQFDDDSGRLEVALADGRTLVILDAEPDEPDVDASFEWWIDGAR